MTTARVEEKQPALVEPIERTWWKETIVYQIYPRSFKDSNGDGIGDLRGIIEKLDYIKSLGVGTVWLNPIYASPNDDNGYDISNYEAIMEEFGTMQDFDELLQGLHERGIRLLMDLVVNHTSDEHQWFRESRSSRDNRYRDYYHWWPAERGTPPARFSFFDDKGSAWQYDQQTDAYFLHYFSKRQPDLNWENPVVRREIYKMMRFWFEKGVDGFRLDAITYIAKDTAFPELSKDEIKEPGRDWSHYYAHGPNLHAYLREMHHEALDGYDVVTMAESPGISKNEALLFVHSDRKEMHMMYHFEGMGLGYVPGAFKRPHPNGYSLVEFKKLYTEWDRVFEREGWGTIYLGNHDQPRMVSRWGNDAPEFRVVSAKMLITFLLTMRATPIFYNGDEIGMENIKFNTIDEYRDVETLMMYAYLKGRGEDVDQFLLDQKVSARDNSRTPFQWNATGNAGFTTGTPWLKVHPDHTYINSEAQDADPHSVLNYFRRLVQLRKDWLVLIYGHYTLYDETHAQVYAYTRTLGREGVLVVLNFSKEVVLYNIPSPLRVKAEPIINSETSLQFANDQLTLLPYQAVVLELGP